MLYYAAGELSSAGHEQCRDKLLLFELCMLTYTSIHTPVFKMRSLIAALAIARASSDFISASDPMVLWNGRPNVDPNDGSVSFDWISTSASFAVAGIGANVTMFCNTTLAPGDVGRFSIYMNDYEIQNILVHSGTGSYLIAAATTFAVNNITVYYSLEVVESGANRASNQVVSIFGFETGLGGTFQPSAPLAKRIDIIGDSITAGSGYDKLESVNGQMSLETGCHPWAPSTGNSQVSVRLESAPGTASASFFALVYALR